MGISTRYFLARSITEVVVATQLDQLDAGAIPSGPKRDPSRGRRRGLEEALVTRSRDPSEAAGRITELVQRDPHAFTIGTGRRLRRIGLILLAIAPVNILSFTLGGMVISAWATGDSLHGAVAIEDGDLYAIVVGLVITATGHMMLEAQRLSEENQSFV